MINLTTQNAYNLGGQAEWCGKWKCIQAHVFIYPASLCLLVGAFKPFTLKVVDMYDPTIHITMASLVAQWYRICLQCRRPRFGWGRSPWRREWQPTAVFLPGESHGQGNLVGYSPWGHKESDTTEATNTYTWSYYYFLNCFGFILCRSFRSLEFPA